MILAERLLEENEPIRIGDTVSDRMFPLRWGIVLDEYRDSFACAIFQINSAHAYWIEPLPGSHLLAGREAIFKPARINPDLTNIHSDPSSARWQKILLVQKRDPDHWSYVSFLGIHTIPARNLHKEQMEYVPSAGSMNVSVRTLIDAYVKQILSGT